ncbi:hypothetical protein [Nocardiopsis sp. CNR-923]|uniref:hypothetical protein n=1 Tax=Nocardiopsis sp. CNR-923 TaxID=1904965 RepID=UPI0009F9FF30|nr:hypothetical protein [Nocardiopsis sp. CNR-923]
MVTPPTLTARRLLGTGALFIALGAFGAAFATPAVADELVWGTAQARAADGDLLAAHATATSFGDDIEDTAATEVLLGPLAPYSTISGEAVASIDAEGAHATTTVESATVRLGVDDLVDLGLVEPPEGWVPTTAAAAPDEGAGEAGPDATAAPDAPDAPEAPEAPEAPLVPEATPTAAETAAPGPGPSVREPDEEPGGDGDQLDDATAGPSTGPEPVAPPSSGVADDVLFLGGGAAAPAADGVDTVGFTLTDVVSTASAGYDGRTETSLEYGELTAFGVDVEDVEDSGTGYVVDDRVAFLDDEGTVIEELRVRVGFAVNESEFEDEDEGWDGHGVRTWLTVWVQVDTADSEDADRLVVEFAQARALGSTHEPGATGDPGDGDRSPSPSPPGGPASTPQPDPARDRSDNRLATTGGSLVALVVAAVVAVGGGTTATLLARKRTTALDDRIED